MRIIFVSGGLGPLQMISELNTGRCASNEAKPRRGMDTRWCANKDTGPRKGWIGGSHINWRRERVPVKTLGPEGIPHRLERRTKHSL